MLLLTLAAFNSFLANFFSFDFSDLTFFGPAALGSYDFDFLSFFCFFSFFLDLPELLDDELLLDDEELDDDLPIKFK